MPLLATLFARAERRLQVGTESWFVHTYTRERSVPGTEDPYGEAGPGGYAAEEPGIDCYYQQNAIQTLDASGNPVTVSQITLTLAADDPLGPNDRVSQILDRKRVVVQAGPILVDWIQVGTSFGPKQYVVAYMQKASGIA